MYNNSNDNRRQNCLTSYGMGALVLGDQGEKRRYPRENRRRSRGLLAW